MDREMEVLLTNDDGIDSPGLHALYDALSSFADVTIVAPADDQSAVGRAISERVTIEPHERGYAVGGTPADCVIAGLKALELSPDVVVSGCNRGANLGTYVLGRSGTVSAAIEAALFDVPSLAVSLYIPDGEWPRETVPDDYREAVRSTSYLVRGGLRDGLFGEADYLNVNAPLPDASRGRMQVTRPSSVYAVTAEEDDDGIRLRDRTWSLMRDGASDDPPGTDRRAVVDGYVSVSPLSPPTAAVDGSSLAELVERYPEDDHRIADPVDNAVD